VSGQFHTLAALPLGKVPLGTSLDRKLGEPQSWSGHGSKENQFLLVLVIEPRVSSPVTILTELPPAPITDDRKSKSTKGQWHDVL